jgi:hypothetical protein
MRDAGQQEACPVWRTYTDDALSAPIVPAMASDRSSGKVRSSCAAMLTGMVTIAVFAAFWPCVMGALLSDAEFKRVCASHQLDVSRYGRQKRQETATKWHGGRQKRQGCEMMRSHPHCYVRGCRQVMAACLPRYAVVQVPAVPRGAG